MNKLIKWFDNDAVNANSLNNMSSNDAAPHLQQIDWLRVIPFVALHLACICVFWVGFSWFALGFAVVLYAIRMFAITGFYHRYFSHKAFKTTRFFQFILAILGATAVQRGPLWWHRITVIITFIQTNPMTRTRLCNMVFYGAI